MERAPLTGRIFDAYCQPMSPTFSSPTTAIHLMICVKARTVLAPDVFDQKKGKGSIMYKCILVPVALEHEGKGEAALALAQTLREAGGKVMLLHVTDAIPGYLTSYIPEETLEKNRREAAAELRILAEQSGEDAEVKVVSGHASQSILGCAEEIGADLIVIASHRPGLERFFLGSTAARVVRHATCAVHVIK